MSVGGVVYEVILQNDRVYIDTVENDSGYHCAIFVDRDENSEKVTKGDIVWWQGGSAYWTTKDRKTIVERTLNRRGFSGVKRPETPNDI